MKFKKIIFVSILIAIFAIGAVSAADDIDALAVEDTGDDAFVESPLDENVVEIQTVDEDVVEVEENMDDLSYPSTDLDSLNNLTPEDFNVTFPTTEFDLDKEDQAIITYFTPEGITQYSSDIVVYYGEGEFDSRVIQMELADVGAYKNIKWGDLYIWDAGVYNLTVYYSYGLTDFLELGRATINVTNNHESTADDIIFIYNYVTNGMDEDCLAEVYDDEVGGLNGVVTAYANGTQIYTKSYSNYNRGGPIHAKDLAGSFNGVYNIKVEYKRADGKVFEISKMVYFDNVVGGESISTKIIVKPASLSMAYVTNKALVATLTDANGKPIKDVDVYVDVMGVSYPIKTDKNGQVKQSLSSLPPKTSHVIKFTFKETASYKASSAKATVKVTKATPKLTAKAKTFKKSAKTKNYAVTLKTNTNKVMKSAKLTLKVNGKTYSATTNAKGQATFKITKLTKKGTFSATVKYAGNNYYSSKTVKVKIAIK